MPELDDDELQELLLRGWALLCAASHRGGTTATPATVRREAEKHLAWLKGEDPDA